MGRPRSPDPRQSVGGLRLSSVERAEFDGLVRASGLSRAMYMRRRLLGQDLPRPVPAVNRDAWAALARLASNLNQAVKLANSGQPVPWRSDDLVELSERVAALRSALLRGGE